MSFKRTATVASALTVIAIVGVMYMSFGSQNQVTHNESHNSMATIATHLSHKTPEQKKCIKDCKLKNSSTKKECKAQCTKAAALLQVKPAAEVHAGIYQATKTAPKKTAPQRQEMETKTLP